MRMARFERWGVRPISQKRFVSLYIELEKARMSAIQAEARVEARVAEAEARAEARVAEAEARAEARVAEAEARAEARVAEAEARAEATVTQAESTREEATRLFQETERKAVSLRQSLDLANQTVEHLRRVEREAVLLRQSLDLANQTMGHVRWVETHVNEAARAGVRTFLLEFQNILFGIREPTAPAEAAASVISQNGLPRDAIDTLINLSENAHGARSFQYLVPMLGLPSEYPLPWQPGDPPLRIIDVGSQELAAEQDVYAPLRLMAPLAIVGFDPFLEDHDARERPLRVRRRRDGLTVETYPDLIGDGEQVRFRINKYPPTSSTLPSNHSLTRDFGLLDLALETIEERSLPSCRLDDILTDDTQVDMLKIDVQGASHVVLSHAPAVLARTLLCHVEAEFAEVYAGERLFGDIDTLLRNAGFDFVDFHSLGRQRYASFENSPRRAYHRGRTLWCDAVYVRGLDRDVGLGPNALRRIARILHCCYNKHDVAAELLRRADALDGASTLEQYFSNTMDTAGRSTTRAAFDPAWHG
jgi:hypothetical protein